MQTAFAYSSAFAGDSLQPVHNKTASKRLGSFTVKPPTPKARVVMAGEKSTAIDNMASVKGAPLNLPFCRYPKRADVAQHGLQNFPESLPIMDLKKTKPYRSLTYTAVSADNLSNTQVLQLIEMMAASFAKREPVLRYLIPPKYPGEGLTEKEHTDALGTDVFGPWTSERLIYWFMRLLILTNPTAPLSQIEVNDDTLKNSVAIVDASGEAIGAILNQTYMPLDFKPAFREDDIFLDATGPFGKPMYNAMKTMSAACMTALSSRYSSFEEAYKNGKVAHMFMLARCEKLPKEDTFEMVAASGELLRDRGFEYMMIEGSNQWTGAACEALNGVRVYFAPFQGWQSVQKSSVPLEGIVSSPNGWLSDKDSGVMCYVVRFS